MEEYGVPHLCGGILFNLILEARKQRKKKRDRQKHGTDNLSNVDVYSGLAYVITGDRLDSFSGGTLGKCVSSFRSCDNSKGTYIPFTDSSVRSAFVAQMKIEKEVIYERIIEFKDQYLNEAKCEWLVRALVDTIQKDGSIVDSQVFAVRDNLEVQKNELTNVGDFSFPTFLGSVLGYVMEYCPDCESGRETFLTWYRREGERCEWKYAGDAGNNITPIKLSFEIDTVASGEMLSATEIVEAVAADETGESDESVTVSREETDEEAQLEARRFCIKHEEELGLIPLCQIAYNVNSIHNNVRQMYTEYNMCSSKVKKEILRINNTPEMKFAEDWIYYCIDKYEIEIKELGLTEIEFLYGGGKYFRAAYEGYANYEIIDFDPRIFDRPYKGKVMNDKTTLDVYINDFLWYKNNHPEHYVEPPMYYLWRVCGLGNGPEEDVTFWVCKFIISSSFQIPRDTWCKDNKWEFAQFNDDSIRTFEDLYYYALFCLYLLYMVEGEGDSLTGWWMV